MKKQIKVKREHIRRGVEHDANYCAVALAIRDVVKDGSAVEVGGAEIMINFRTRRTPAKVVNFMTAFDEKKSAVAPFAFNLDIPKTELRSL